MALVRYWLEDEDFKAKSIQKKVNRGHGGTHNKGNKPSLSMGRTWWPLMEGRRFLGSKFGRRLIIEKKGLPGGEVAYYGKNAKAVYDYKEAFKSLHGLDSDPLS